MIYFSSESNASVEGCTFEEASSASLSHRALPPYEYCDLRPKIKEHDNLYDPRLEVLEFRDCLVNRYGLLKLSDGRVITDIGYRHNVERSLEQFSKLDVSDTSIKSIIEPVVLIGGHNNYYHWHFNWMPRVVLTDMFDDLRDHRLLIHGQPARFVTDSLERATGRKTADALFLAGPVMRLKHVFVPSFFMNPVHAPFALRSYQGQRRWRARGEGRKVYISRSEADCRKIINEAETVALLERYGFESVIAEKLSYAEQVQLFSEASFVVGAHGAGLTNMLFCNPGFCVLELMNQYFTRVYWSLAVALGSHQYKNLMSEDVFPNTEEKDPVQAKKNSDFIVDLDKLKTTIEAMMN